MTRRLVPLAALAAAAACGGDIVLIPPSASVVATPASIVAVRGDTVRVRLADTGGRTVRVVALGVLGEIATVDAAGLVTAMSPGTGVVTVEATVGGQLVTTSVPITVLGLVLDPPNVSMTHGAEVRLAATPVGDPARYGALRWTSSDTSVVTVDAGGTVRGVAPGIARIAATSSAYPTVRAESEITIATAQPIVRSLVVTPTALTLQPGDTARVTATVMLPIGAPPSVPRGALFSSSDTSVVTVTADGLVTARRGGTAIVTVAAAAAPTVTQAVSVTVREPGRGRLTIASITTGDPPVPANLDAVRGTIRVTVNLTDDVAVRRAELRLDGALAAVREDVPRVGTDGLATVDLHVDTSLREPASGARRYPNGPTTLAVRLAYGPDGSQLVTIQQPVVLANP